MGGWTLADVRALEDDEYTTLLQLIRKGSIRPPGLGV